MDHAVVNGMPVYYHSDFVAPYEKNKISVIFIHGSGGSSLRWKKQFPVRNLFDDDNFQKVQFFAIDLPGHARSQESEVHTIKSLTDTVDEFVNVLGLNNVILTGHSLGGAIALQSALNQPLWLKGLILAGTGAKLRVLPSIIEDLKKNRFPKTLVSMAYSPATSLELMKEMEFDSSLTPKSILLKDLLACDTFDIRTDVNTIDTPTLIVVGSDDQLTPIKYAQFLNDNIKNSVLVTIPDAGHMVMSEQPKLFNKEIIKFILSVNKSLS